MHVPAHSDRSSIDGSSSITSDQDRPAKEAGGSPASARPSPRSRIPRRTAPDRRVNGSSRDPVARENGARSPIDSNHSRREGGSGNGPTPPTRVRSDSFLLSHVKDWTENDVGKFYDIVLEAERILPSLSPRDRQPTTALFNAFETVLQRAGQDASDNAIFLPLIFQVGAEAGVSLVEKAKKVLDRLGFEVEWVPDDLTENFEYYQSLDSSQLKPHLLPANRDRSRSPSRPDGDPRHVRWRDQNGDAAAAARLHDSFTYDRPSSYSGSNTGGTRDGWGSPRKAPGPTMHDLEEEGEENSDSFDTYYSEEPPASRPNIHPPTPARKLSNGIQRIVPSENDSSSHTSSPDSPNSHHSIDDSNKENYPQQSFQGEEGVEEPAVSKPKSPARKGLAPAGGVELDDDTPRPFQSQYPMPPPLQTRLLSGSDQPRGGSGASLPVALFPQSNSSQQSPERERITREPGSGNATSPTASDGERFDERTIDSNANLTVSVPQIFMFRAHAQKFRHQSLLRKWRAVAEANRQRQIARTEEARQFFNVRLADITLFSWRSQAQFQWEHRLQLEEMAAQFDGRKLAETTCEVWKDKAAARRRERLASEARQHDTEVFFEGLGARAERAYNFYILAKALTHWVVRAQEERGRTETARRHMMRIRYFDSWKEYTAVNELKVRQFVSKKVFASLQGQVLERHAKTQTALQLHQGRLAERALHQWRRLNRGKLIVFIRDKNIAKGALSLWAEQAREITAQKSESQSRAGQATRQGLLEAWKNKARARSKMEIAAQDVRERNLKVRIFVEWGRRAELGQMCDRFVAAKRRRLLEGMLGVWSRRAGLQQNARALDYVKTLKEVLSQWSMKQKTRQLRRKVDRRIVTDTMYKWFVAEHQSLLSRVRSDRLLQRTLDGLRRSTAAKKDSELRNDRIGRNFHDRQLKTQPFKAWYARLDRLTRMEQQADEFYRFHLKRRVWRVLAHTAAVRTDQAEEARRQYTWTAWHKSLRKWKTAQEKAYKEKLAVAYKTCRRNTKINTVHRTLRQLNARAFQRAQQEFVAEQLAAHEAREAARRALHAWRVRTEGIRAIDSHGYNILQVGVLGRWREQLTQRETDDARAREFDRDKRLHAAIRAWALKGLQLRARCHTAVEVQEKANRTNVRKCLDGWYRATSQRVWERGTRHEDGHYHSYQSSPPPSGPGSAPRGEDIEGYFGSTLKASAPVLSTPAPRDGSFPNAPGRGGSLYLRTPTPGTSRRLNSRISRAQSQNEGRFTPNPFLRQSPRKKELGSATRQTGGATRYLIHRRGASLPDVRRPSRLGTYTSLGPYPPFDEDEEEEPPPIAAATGEVELEPLKPDVPTEEEDTAEEDQGQMQGSRAPSRAVSRTGTSTPTPLRFSTRMPSTTPLAPLPTPFEKQLRQQYGSGRMDGDTPGRHGTRPRLSSLSTPRVPVATGLEPPGRAVSGGSDDADVDGPGSAVPSRSRLAVPNSARFRGGLALSGKRSVGRVRFTGDVRSASDSSTGAVVEGSKEK